MSLPHPAEPPITRRELRQAARVLISLADQAKQIDREQLRRELKRVGQGQKIPVTAAEPMPAHDQPGNENPPTGRAGAHLPPPTGPPEIQPIWVRPAEAARLLGIGKTLLYRWMNSGGRLVVRKIGSVTLISVQSIRDLTGDPSSPTP